jgi:hypothetical protein
MSRVGIAVAAVFLLVAGLASAAPQAIEELKRPTTELDRESLGELPRRPDGKGVIEFQRSDSPRRRYRDLRTLPNRPGENPYDLYLHMTPEALLEEIDRAWELLRNERFLIEPDLRAELLLRLGVAYEEYSHYLRSQELESYHRSMQACRLEGRKDCGEVIEPSFEESRSLEKDAANLYSSLLWNFPNHYTVDEAAWRLENVLAALEAG